MVSKQHNNNDIHPTAIIAPGARIGQGIKIGPYCIIGSEVKLGQNVRLHSHIVIDGDTEIGEGTTIFPFASVGLPPQDLKFKGEKSQVIIGKNNTIREYVTINPGTEGGGLITRIGNNCLFMVGSHIAHDCKVGNNVIMANNAAIAGHVEVGDFVVIGGLAAIHQFVRIGHHAMIGGMSGIENDVIPYGLAMGERAGLAGLNLNGLKRRNFDRETIHALRNAFKELFNNETAFANNIEAVKEKYKEEKAVMDIINFLSLDSSRAVCQPKKNAL